MGFFKFGFAALTLRMQLGWAGTAALSPFFVFACVAAAAVAVIRMPGQGPRLSERAKKTVVWSSAAEGAAIFVVYNVLINVGRQDLILPEIAIVVGLHFIPIATATGYKPFLVIGLALLAT